ncbi:MAG: aspartate carbamoyltransferase catalytic subunit [Mariprofundales bacterium]
MKNNLLGMSELSLDNIEYLLQSGAAFVGMSQRRMKKAPTLKGCTIINLFFENSTRTRTSFELAGKRLSADVINISATSSAVKKGETLLDTGRTLQAMHPDALVLRHSLAGAAHFLADYLPHTAIINAGDGAHEHPSQVLADLLTLQAHWGENLEQFKGKVITMVGDIAHSRVARSHLLAAQKIGYKIRLVAPKTLLPMHVERFGCEVFHDFDAAIQGSDALYMLRVQQERQTSSLAENCSFPSIREYHEAYGLNKQRLQQAATDIPVLHPGPLNRGVEIATDVADGISSNILAQVENGLGIRMALLAWACLEDASNK